MPQAPKVQSPGRRGMSHAEAFEYLFDQIAKALKALNNLTEEQETLMATAKEARDAAKAAFDNSDKLIATVADLKQQVAEAVANNGKVPQEVQDEIDGIFADAQEQLEQDKASLPQPAPDNGIPAPEGDNA